MSKCKLLSVSAADNSLIYSFTPSQHYANLNNVVHGGAFGILFDMFTMTTLGTVAGLDYWEFMGGVSRTINMSFLRAAPVGRELFFHCRVVQHGRTMAMVRGECRDEGGRLYATAEHHKVHAQPLKEHKEERIAFDDVLEREAAEKKKKAKL